MDDQDTRAVSSEHSTGRVVMGVLLVAAGAALLIERLGALPPQWRTSIWPVLLFGYGLARLMQPTAHGREGLFFVVAGGWWLGGTSGWYSLERTWPVLIVAFGLSIVFQSITSPRGEDAQAHPFGRRRHGAAPVIVAAILFGAAITSGLGRGSYAQQPPSESVLRVYSVIGGTNSRMRATTLAGGEVVSIMGGSSVDLRDATIAPGQTVTLDVFALMGGGAIRVPDEWVVDIQVVPVFGSVKDQRRVRGESESDAAGAPGVGAAPPGPRPRLILRGSIIMGGLAIRS